MSRCIRLFLIAFVIQASYLHACDKLVQTTIKQLIDPNTHYKPSQLQHIIVPSTAGVAGKLSVTGILNINPGNLYRLPVDSDYSFFVFVTEKGEIHYFDSESKTVFFRFLKKPIPSLSEGSITSRTRLFHGNRKKLKERSCSLLTAMQKHPESKKMNSFINRNPKAIEADRILTLGRLLCAGSGVSLFAFWHIWRVTFENRKKIKKHFPLVDHTSNFMLGLPFLLWGHYCTNSFFRTNQVKLAAGLAGFFAAYNVFEEVGVKKINDMETDWKDLASGGTAILTYLLIVKFIEKKLSFSIKKACK